MEWSFWTIGAMTQQTWSMEQVRIKHFDNPPLTDFIHSLIDVIPPFSFFGRFFGLITAAVLYTRLDPPFLNPLF